VRESLLREFPSGCRDREVSSGDVEAHGNTHRPEPRGASPGP
jgi:hypothetical protein